MLSRWPKARPCLRLLWSPLRARRGSNVPHHTTWPRDLRMHHLEGWRSWLSAILSRNSWHGPILRLTSAPGSTTLTRDGKILHVYFKFIVISALWTCQNFIIYLIHFYFTFLKPKTFDIFYLQFDCENFFYLLDNFNVKNLIVTYISMHQKVNR